MTPAASLTATESTSGRRPWRWPRLVAIGSAAIALASCRSISQPVVVPVAAVAALATWDSEKEIEPSGWIRCIRTGRRRPDGDATKEYIQF